MPGATPNLALPYPVAADTADVPRDIKALADKLDLSGAVGTALPATPVDGQEYFYLANASLGIVWLLRYRSGAAGAYKWDVIGGSPLYAVVETLENTSVGAFTDLATVGPQFNLPLAGDYMVRFGATMSQTTATFAAIAGLGVGGTFAPDNRVVINAGAAADSAAVARATKASAVAAGALAKLAYFVTGGSGGFSRRWLEAMPVRVG